jgi:hypothetical protein
MATLHTLGWQGGTSEHVGLLLVLAKASHRAKKVNSVEDGGDSG